MLSNVTNVASSSNVVSVTEPVRNAESVFAGKFPHKMGGERFLGERQRSATAQALRAGEQVSWATTKPVENDQSEKSKTLIQSESAKACIAVSVIAKLARGN